MTDRQPIKATETKRLATHLARVSNSGQTWDTNRNKSKFLLQLWRLYTLPPSPSSRPSAVPLKSEGKLLRCGNLVWAEPAVLGRPRSLGRWPPQGRPTLERDSQDFFVFPTFLCWCLWRLFGNAVQTITVVVSAPNHSSRPHVPLEIVNRCPLATCQMKSCFMVIKSRHFASCTLLQRELGGALGPEMFLVKEIAWHRNGWTKLSSDHERD